jgi:glycosyltransferase 2 family protein
MKHALTPIMQQSKPSHTRWITAFILTITLVGVLVVASDWQKMWLVLSEADWRYIPLGLVFTFLSYGFYSYGYAIVAQMLDIPMRKRELAEVCFISSVVNHVLTTGGVVGYSLRYLLMRMYRVSFKDVLSSSMFHVYLTSLDMLTFLPLSFIYLIDNASVPRSIEVALGMMTLIFALILILTTSLFIFPAVRQPIINILSFLGRKILRRDYSPWLTQLNDSLTSGTLAIRRRPSLLAWIMFLTLADFICSIAVMGIIFIALGSPISVGILVSGYVIGIMAGLLSMVPGGFGIQEASMAGVYALLGVPLEQAILAAILFRVIYYLVPYFCILPFYNRLVFQAKQQAMGEP